MKALSFKEPWVNTYVERLLGLSTTTKKAIIRALERSMEKPEKEKKERKGTMAAFGAWVGPESAEEIIGWIEDARTTGPERESLD